MRVMPIAPQLNIVQNGLVLWVDPSVQTSYPGSGTEIIDLSGNGNNGALTNGPTYNSDNGGSIVLDGSNDFITFGDKNAFTLSSGFTLQIWVRFSALTSTTNAALLAKYPNTNTINKEYALGINGGRVFIFLHRNTTSTNYIGRIANSVIVNGWLVNNTWVMITGTYSGGTSSANLSIYINSTKRDDANYNQGVFTGISNGTEALNIGHPNIGLTFDTEYLNGRIGPAMVYNRALTQDEITHNFNTQRVRFGI